MNLDQLQKCTVESKIRDILNKKRIVNKISILNEIQQNIENKLSLKPKQDIETLKKELNQYLRRYVLVDSDMDKNTQAIMKELQLFTNVGRGSKN